MTHRHSAKVLGQPWQSMRGMGAGPLPRSCTACSAIPSISPRTSAWAFSNASRSRQSKSCRHVEIRSVR